MSQWSGLFSAAFRQSQNAMALLDSHRRHVEVNGAYLKLIGYKRAEVIGRPIYEFVPGGPIATEAEWQAMLDAGHLTGEVELRHRDGSTVKVQWAGTVEVITGHRRVLFVALSISRWGRSFRRMPPADHGQVPLSDRELAVVRLVARGDSGPEIAGELRIAHNTVRTHVRNAMDKTGARSRAHLVAKVLAEGHFAKVIAENQLEGDAGSRN